MTHTLTRYEAARAALAAAVSTDEIMAVELTASALEKVGKIAKDFQLELDAYVLRTRARLRLGETLDRADAAGLFGKGRHVKGVKSSDTEQLSRVKLAEVGIDRKLSADSRRLSGIGAQAVEALLVRVRDESAKRGTVARDVLKTKEREDRHAARVRLQRELSDTSANLAGGRKFPVIYGDPATRFLSGFGPKSIENHYPTMTMDELCELPVAARCLKDCQLFVWTTVPQLANTITLLLPAWGGFKYSSHCIWDKTDAEHEKEMAAGLVFRNQHEVLIYATRGNPPGPKYRPASMYRERKREHSRKPDHYREMIRRMTGGLPVLELFARVDAEHPMPPGFYAWGNQAGDVIDASSGEVIGEGVALDESNHENALTDSKSEASTCVDPEPADPNDPEGTGIPIFCRRESVPVVSPRVSTIMDDAGRGD